MALFIHTEIRLEIYGYLLVAYPSRLRPRKSITFKIKCKWDEDQWKTTAINNTGSRSGDCNNTGLTPQILRTCKAVYREATPMLYSENIFQFQPREDDALLLDGFAKDNLKVLCREFYPNPEVHLTETPLTTPIYSILAVFLRQIGQQNAASLKTLMFFTGIANFSAYAQDAGQSIEVVTQILKFHVPGLGQLVVCRGLTGRDGRKYDHWELLDKGRTGVRDQEHDASQVNVPRAQTSTSKLIEISITHAHIKSEADTIPDAVSSLAKEGSREFQIDESTENEQKLPGSDVGKEGQTAELPATSNSHAGEEMENDTESEIDWDHVPSDDSGDETFPFAWHTDDFDDEGTDGKLWPPLACRREEQEAIQKATAEMVQEIIWLKQLSFAGFDEDDPAYQKMKDLQMLVKTRR
ncbi:MAG: hypothetical protein Q9161_009835 [Pseudevernia consocians]